jgi:hypothetical protein
VIIILSCNADPVDIHTYYVIHVDGVYIVTLSWLSKLDMFTAADCKLSSLSFGPNTNAETFYVLLM